MAEVLESKYPPVMEDMARRLVAAELSLAEIAADPENPYVWVCCEIVVLQLRKMCELLLLGSTLAHAFEGGLDLSLKKWRPKDAFGQLEKVSEHPLPMHVTVDLDKHGPGQHHLTPVSQPLTYEALGYVYGTCGDLLHVPTGAQVLKGKLPSFDVDLLRRWVAGFKQITCNHVLMLPKREKILFCRWSGEKGAPPSLVLMEAKGPSTMKLDDYPPFDLLP